MTSLLSMNNTVHPPPQTLQINILKKDSNHIRDPLRDEMAGPHPDVNHNAYQLLKFHGSYLQDDRSKRTKGAEKDYSFMLRLKMPGGDCPPSLFALLDDLSNEYGQGNLRLTTRQTYQLHGVKKPNLKHVIKSIMKVGGSTVGGCGDVNRNIMTTPAPITDKPEYGHARYLTRVLAEVLRPVSNAFAELWLDSDDEASLLTETYWREGLNYDIEGKYAEDNGRGIVVNDPEEPIYGNIYLPRKFKIGVTVPGDNSIDIYTNDIGFVTVVDDSSGELLGYNVMVGGGMGRTHRKDTTFARAADHMGFVTADKAVDVARAILAVQRDHGNREIRANARMKYLVHTLGVDRFKLLVESYTGFPIEPWRLLKEWRYSDWMGWHKQGGGKWFLGINIENGRIIDREGEPQMKSFLRAVTDKLRKTLVCTPNQSLIIKDISENERGIVEDLMTSYSIKRIEEYDPLVRLSMACPALPMCGLAMTEAERRMPDYNVRIRSLLDKVGLENEEIQIRMTGCPNGCARPYMAELAFVGDGPDTYQIWMGGTPYNDRVGYPYQDRMKDKEMERTIEPIMRVYKAQRQNKSGTNFPETFGEWSSRLGKEGVELAVSSK